MNIKIIQPAGLGDILFCLKIAKELIAQGHTIYWPVIAQYRWIANYIAFERLNWRDIDNPDRTIDLQSGGRIFPDMPFMNAKYAMVGMTYDGWQDAVSFQRNKEKEEILYSLSVKKEPYCLICDIFASPPNLIIRQGIKSVLPEIKIRMLDGYTPFDWCKIIENAGELRFVDTCFTHIVEKLDIKADKIVLYSRDGRFYTKHLWKKPWEYVL